jgi:acyl transferase domain-containing protein/phosphopantetheinyl transferase
MSMSQDAPATSTPIAIVGMACIFPGAADLKSFWNNIVGRVDSICQPQEAWGAERYLESGRITTQYGGFLKDLYRFDPREFGIMPNSIDGSEPDQFLALRVARDALLDAGYLRADADHTDTGIVLGHSTYLHRGQGTLIQQNIVLDQTVDLLRVALPHLNDAALGELRDILRRKLPPTTADTVPGLVPNVMTGRIANRLNLRGPNFLLDAACSSSLLAVGVAIDELRARRSRMMLAGGVNATLPAEVTTIFTQLGALSTRRKVRPFERGSDGTLLGEGLGVVVLKRLDDALADDDRVYAIIRGIGQSSDGRGSGLLAPSQEGETLAMARTYQACDVDPGTIGLFEAHGTGIPLGDQTEIASLQAVFGTRSARVGTCALGSVKSMISHCIPAAGIAGLIKVALAIHHRLLPPTLCDEVNPELGIQKTPFYVNTRAAPWVSKLNVPRRAGVNAFGFGGTNSHAIVEQAPSEVRRPATLTSWPAELCVVSAQSAEALAAKLEALGVALSRNATWRLDEVAAALARADRQEQHRIALVGLDLKGLAKAVAQSAAKLRSGGTSRWPTRGNVSYSAARLNGKLAFLFPGEGSQYLEMFADLARHFPEIQHWLDFWHGLYELPKGSTRTDIAYPSCEVDADGRLQLEKRFHDMDVGSEAVYVGGLAMHALLRSLGVEPDVMVGHSSGESAALTASGANGAADAAAQADCIRRHYAVYKELLESGKIPEGALLAVGALGIDVVESHVSRLDGVVVAMDNCGNQIVLFGPPSGIKQAQSVLTTLGGVCIPLPFDRGYHTAAFTDASAAFHRYYEEIGLGVPKVPLYSCSSVGLFPASPRDVCDLAAAQWSNRVRFRETILKMHDDGVILFLEVGPSANLTAFVNDILAGRDVAALPTNVRGRNEIEQLLAVLGRLYVAGRGPIMARLFSGRAIRALDLDKDDAPPGRTLIDNTMPIIRLTPADCDAIRRITGRDASQLPPAAQLSGAVQTPIAEARAPDVGVESADDEHKPIMAEYFDVMRHFLDRQTSLLERWTGLETHVESRASTSPGWVSMHAADGETPLLDNILERDDQHVLARCDVSLANDQFARDHVMTGPVTDTDPHLFGLSCLPLAVSLELMAEACALLAGRLDVTVIENIHALDWIALDEEAATVDVKAEVVDSALGHFRASVSTPRGPALTADYRFGASFRLPELPPLAERRASCWNAPDLYSTGMFHGPVFRSLRYIDAWDYPGVDVQLSDVSLRGFFSEGHTPKLILNPVLLDALGQVVACWLVQFFGTEFNNFPSTIGRIEIHERCPADRQGVVMRTRQRALDGVSTDPGASRAWEFDCVDADGRVLLRADELINVFWRLPPAYHAVRWRPLLGWLGGPLPAPNRTGVSLWKVPFLPAEFLLQSGAICLRTLAHVLLNTQERAEWRALKAQPRRRIEWLFGRAALKEAVRHWVQAQTGQLLYPTDITVIRDENGAPVVDGWWCNNLIAAPEVSLSHNSDSCVAAVAPPDQPVGVDIEQLDRLQHPEFVAQALAPDELALVHGLRGAALNERVLRIWCAKESASKCLGLGLRGEPQAYRVVAADHGFDTLTIRHEAGSVEVSILQQAQCIVACATLEWKEVAVHE